MKLFLFLAAACSIANAAAPSGPYAAAAAPAAAASVAAVSAPAALVSAESAPAAAPKATVATAPPAAPMPMAAASAGSLLQTILALCFVLALLAGLAWFMKRYGPKAAGGNAALRLVGSLSLGGRERIIVIEVADQWIVVGASPGRVNALATMPRQESVGAAMPAQQNGLAGAGFSEWLKQTIEKRNAK